MKLIDVEEMQKWLERWKGYLDDDMIRRMQICSKDIPTIEERKKGRWIIREALLGETEAKCPCCGFETIVDEPGNGFPMVSDLHYCPSCGADMREKTNDEVC